MTTQSNFGKYAPWILVVYIAFVFIQSLFFKFSNSFETQHIFNTIGDWMAGIGFLQFAAAGFASVGGYAVGTAELIASLLLLWRRTQFWGALLAFGIISGAIFFHLFTPLGVSVIVDQAGNRDGGVLFGLAVGVWLCAVAIMYLRRGDVLSSR